MNAECKMQNAELNRTWKVSVFRYVRIVFAFLILNSAFFISSAHAQGRLDLGIEYGSLTGLGTREVRETVATLITVALGFLGIVAVVIILAGGFTWMTAGGNEENVESAKKRIIAGIVGLAIILSAYAIANFVIRSLERATIGP